jgi:hypothetical protein
MAPERQVVHEVDGAAPVAWVDPSDHICMSALRGEHLVAQLDEVVDQRRGRGADRRGARHPSDGTTSV